MVTKKILNPKQLCRIEGGFSFIAHRFLSGGFLQTLSRQEMLLCFFLVLVADRHGISFYCDESICNLLGIEHSAYLEGHRGLIEKDLICFENTCSRCYRCQSELFGLWEATGGPRNSAAPSHAITEGGLRDA